MSHYHEKRVAQLTVSTKDSNSVTYSRASSIEFPFNLSGIHLNIIISSMCPLPVWALSHILISMDLFIEATVTTILFIIITIIIIIFLVNIFYFLFCVLSILFFFVCCIHECVTYLCIKVNLCCIDVIGQLAISLLIQLADEYYYYYYYYYY